MVVFFFGARIAEMLEAEEDTYQKVILDPFVNERDGHEIGNLISLVVENEMFVEQVIFFFFFLCQEKKG